MIQGCLDWQRGGLRPPEAVLMATRDYLESEDAVGRWLDDKCCQNPGAWTASSVLYASWKEWCEAVGEFTGTEKRLTQNLKARDFEPSRNRTGRGFQGLGLPNGGPNGGETSTA